MSIKILNEGFKLLHKNSLCEEKSNSSDLEKALEDALNHLAMKQEMNIKKYEIAFQDVIESQYPDKSWWEVTDCDIFWDLAENRDPSLTIKHIVDGLKPEFKESLEESENSNDEFPEMTYGQAKKMGYVPTDIKYQRGYVSRKSDVDNLPVHTAGGNRKGDKYTLLPCYNSSQYCYRQYLKNPAKTEGLRRKRLKESEKEPTIKRYSDVKPYSERKYWYFTTHGVQPGSIPRDLNVLEVRDGQNKKGTWGTFVMLDGVLNTSELRHYDMIELSPDWEEQERRRMRPQGKRITAWESYKKESKERFYASSYDEDRNLTDIETNDVDEVLEFVFERFDESSYFEVEDRVAGKSFTVDVEKYKDSYEAYKKLKKLLGESLKRKSKKSIKESFSKKHAKKLKESHRRKLTESFDDMEVFMNTWANYNEYGADGVLTPTGWMSIDEAIEYCEEYADYEPFINDTDNVPFDDINEYSNASSALQELKELQESGIDEDVLEAIVEATGYDVKEAVEIAESGDYYFYPGLSSYEDLAYEIIDELGGLGAALGDRVVNYIDEDQMRREYRWDIREIMRDSAEDEVDREHSGEVDISNIPPSHEFSIDEWFDEDEEYSEEDLREHISDDLEYEYDSAPISFDIEVSSDGKKVTAKNIEWDGYDREQEIEDWMDEHEDEWLDMIIGEEIDAAERGEADLSSYFDYEAFGRDLSFDGYTITDKGIILVM